MTRLVIAMGLHLYVLIICEFLISFESMFESIELHVYFSLIICSVDWCDSHWLVYMGLI